MERGERARGARGARAGSRFGELLADYQPNLVPQATFLPHLTIQLLLANPAQLLANRVRPAQRRGSRKRPRRAVRWLVWSARPVDS